MAVIALEYYLFRYTAQLVGASTVLWMSLAAAFLGLVLVRRHGLMAMLSADQDLAVGSVSDQVRRPSSPADHALLVAAGLALIVPGLATGALGLLLLLPPVRDIVRARLRVRFQGLADKGLTADGIDLSFVRGGSMFTRNDIVDVDLHRNDSREGDNLNDDNLNDDKPQSPPPELN